MNLIDLRERVELTQEQVAQSLQIDRRSVGNWESGRHQPRLFIWQVRTLLKLYACTLEELEQAIEATQER